MMSAEIGRETTTLACENSRPSSLRARVAFRVKDPSRETPLGPGAKKDGCFRRLRRPIIRNEKIYTSLAGMAPTHEDWN